MKRSAGWLALALLLLCGGIAAAQEIVHFPSLEDDGSGQTSTQLDGYLFPLPGGERRPAVVGAHGCGGLFNRQTGLLTGRDRAWAAELNRQGYHVLLVDSFRPRGHGEMCSITGFDLELYRKRPRDVYGALWFLQNQPFVRGDHVALMGWSQGGGVTLFSIGARSLGRPAVLPQGDFRAAVAFYPGSCNEQRQAAGWTTSIPLLVLIGAADVVDAGGAMQGLP